MADTAHQKSYADLVFKDCALGIGVAGRKICIYMPVMIEYNSCSNVSVTFSTLSLEQSECNPELMVLSLPVP